MRRLLLDKIYKELKDNGSSGRTRRFVNYCYIVIHKLDFLTPEEHQYLWSRIHDYWSYENITEYAARYRQEPISIQPAEALQTPPRPSQRGGGIRPLSYEQLARAVSSQQWYRDGSNLAIDAGFYDSNSIRRQQRPQPQAVSEINNILADLLNPATTEERLI